MFMGSRTAGWSASRGARMKAFGAIVLAAAAGAGLLIAPLRAAEPAARPAAAPQKVDAAAAKAQAVKGQALDPAKAGPDFAVQGEYVGEIAATNADPATPIAAQIASLGGGNFAGAFYIGGLPGAGWDGEHRFAATGKAKDTAMTEVPFASADGGAPEGTAAWAGGSIKGKTQNGEAFELKKVQRTSPTMGAKPPGGAILLYDGSAKDKSNVDGWEDGHADDRGLLAAGTKTKRKFQSFALHGEFILPFKPYGRDQDRANSGFYLQDRYEVQVLDSFAQPPVFNGTGAIYRQTPPDVNMVPAAVAVADVRHRLRGTAIRRGRHEDQERRHHGETQRRDGPRPPRDDRQDRSRQARRTAAGPYPTPRARQPGLLPKHLDR